MLALISLDGVEGGFLIDSEFSPGLGKHGWLKHSNILFWESFCDISGDEGDKVDQLHLDVYFFNCSTTFQV